MKRGTRNIWLLLAAVVLLASVLPSVVAAKGTPNVAAGYHNLSASGIDAYTQGASQYATDESEICVFCHTPHGGSLTGPLWNHDLPTNSFTMYDSQTLGTYLSGLATTRAISDESLLCMSCHDGSVSTNHLINLPNTRNGAAIKTDLTNDFNTTIGLGFILGARTGGTPSAPGSDHDLSDDHPISFSYDEVRNNPPYSVGSRMGQLHDPAAATAAGVRFFNAPSVTPGTNRVECSTCHDPHVDYDYASNRDYAPFLIMPNTGSNLCLACHNK